MSKLRIVLAGVDGGIGARAEALRTAGHAVEIVRSPDAVERIDGLETVDLAVAGLETPDDNVRALRAVKGARRSSLVVIENTQATTRDVIRAFREGAYDYLVDPPSVDGVLALAARVEDILARGEARRRVAEQLEQKRHEVEELRRRFGDHDAFSRVVGRSAIVRHLVETLREVARTEATVLITGESGTGKGLMARAIHDASERRKGPFVEANCVVYSEGVLHSELFGHERGAFTGAAKQRRGRFETACGGTIFLDEIGEIRPTTQLLLLRVLQDRTFERVGGEATLETDARLIAATNRDLQRAMREGDFREDLYYRLNVIPVHLPSLREHSEDIPALAQHFLRASCERLGRSIVGFSAEAMDGLVAYRWPGNVRELENAVERMAVLGRSDRIEVGDLPEPIRAPLVHTRRSGVAFSPPLPTQALVSGDDDRGGARVPSGTLYEIERIRIEEALRETSGNKKLAAKKLGIHRSTLYAKLRRYGLDEPRDPADASPVSSDTSCRERRHDVPDTASRSGSR